MSLMSKKQIESQYDSYEAIAKAFSSSGSECIEIYLCTHSTEDEPSHYDMVHRFAEREALLSSPYIKKTELAWSKNKGAVIPYKSIP